MKITDNFTRANQSPLGASSEGWSWSPTNLEQNDFYSMAIASNQAMENQPGAVMCMRAETDLAGVDSYAQVKLITRGISSGSGGMGVCCRMTSVFGPSYYMAFLIDNAPTLSLYKNTGGQGFVQLGSSVTVPVALPNVMKVQAVGSTIKAFWDGIEKISVTDTTITTGRRAGLRTGGAAGVSRVYDDFEAGDFSVSAGVVKSKGVVLLASIKSITGVPIAAIKSVGGVPNV